MRWTLIKHQKDPPKKSRTNSQLDLIADILICAWVRAPYLVSMCVPADNYRLDPAWNQAGNVFADNSLSEHSSSQDVPDCSVRRAPHLLEFELLHALLVRSDGGTLDANIVVPHSLRCLNSHLVIRGIAVLHSQVIATTQRAKKETLRIIPWCYWHINDHCAFLWFLQLPFSGQKLLVKGLLL